MIYCLYCLNTSKLQGNTSVSHLLFSPSQPMFGLVSQRPLFPVWERTRCVTRPNDVCERDYAYCHSSNREKIKIIPLQLVTSKIYFRVILLRKANWNSVVPLIDPDQRCIVISNEWRYTEQEKRMLSQRGLLDWLLPIWTLPSACEIRDKMQVVLQGIDTQLG